MDMILNNIQYGSDINQRFDIIIPNKKLVHAIVYIHGGAYMIGNKFQYPQFLRKYVKNNIVASIDYRLVNEDNKIKMDDIISDINNAFLKIIELADKNNVYIKGFILIGHSAGAQIGLLYGYKNISDKIKITSCISLSGPTDYTDDLGWSSMTAWGQNLEARLQFFSTLGSTLTGYNIELTQVNWTKQKNYSEVKDYLLEISPITYVSKNRLIPPTLIVHARSDNQVPYSNAIKLREALENNSISHKLITPTGSGNNHMLGGEVISNNSPIDFKNQSWVNETKKWIEYYLR